MAQNDEQQIERSQSEAPVTTREDGKPLATRSIVVPSRFLGARIRPHAQRALNDILEAGLAKDQTEAVESALERLGRRAKRVLRRNAA